MQKKQAKEAKLKGGLSVILEKNPWLKFSRNPKPLLIVNPFKRTPLFHLTGERMTELSASPLGSKIAQTATV
jgi:hypothetical protein